METFKNDLVKTLLTCITKENCIDIFLVSSMINSSLLKLKSSIVFLFNFEYFQLSQNNSISTDTMNARMTMLSDNMEMTFEELFNLILEAYL